MDIPAPSENSSDTDAESTKIMVSSASSAEVKTELKTEEPPKDPGTSTAQQQVESTKEAVDKDDEARKKIVELISSKQYHLGIKEKRSSPLLIVAPGSKKSKKNKKKTTKKSETNVKAKSGKNKSVIQISVLVALLIGFVVAIDADLVSIGISLPFDFIK